MNVHLKVRSHHLERGARGAREDHISAGWDYSILIFDRKGKPGLHPVHDHHRLESFDVIIFVEEATGELFIVLHVLCGNNEEEIRFAGHIVADHHFACVLYRCLEAIDDVSPFSLKGYQNNDGYMPADGLRGHYRDVGFDDARGPQPLEPALAGGRRKMRSFGQFLGRELVVLLNCAEKREVRAVEFHS